MGIWSLPPHPESDRLRWQRMGTLPYTGGYYWSCALVRLDAMLIGFTTQLNGRTPWNREL